GWGRVGAWFGVDRWGVVPDLLTTAKGITGAYAPLGLTATTAALHDTFRDRYFPHGHTYEAHPLTLAPAVAAIGEYRRLDLLEKSRRDGEYLLDRLRGDPGPAPLGRRRPGSRPVRGGRARPRPGDPRPVQRRGGQARRPDARCRPGRGGDAPGRRLLRLVDLPPRDRPAPDRHARGTGPGPGRPRPGPGRRRRR
ncbi:Aminotransferase class-III, partial [mine drainage metagenome]